MVRSWSRPPDHSSSSSSCPTPHFSSSSSLPFSSLEIDLLFSQRPHKRLSKNNEFSPASQAIFTDTSVPPPEILSTETSLDTHDLFHTYLMYSTLIAEGKRIVTNAGGGGCSTRNSRLPAPPPERAFYRFYLWQGTDEAWKHGFQHSDFARLDNGWECMPTN